jgi:hypothetical protein
MGRITSPTPSDATTSVSPTGLARSESIMKKRPEMTKSPEDFYSTTAPMQSMFPAYDPAARLSQQMYYPQRPAPIQVPFEKVSKPEYSPRIMDSAISPPKYQEIAPMKKLEGLWDVANGQITAAPLTGAYNLKMFRYNTTDAKRGKKMSFGPSQPEAFYSVSHAPPLKDEDELHEALMFRHHTSQDDLLPIAHTQITPPPVPTVSKSHRNSQQSDPTEPATHISTITPVLATLHALDNASKTPQAHKLALVDPKAESPAAAKLAERAVKDATERESCTLTWMRTCPRTGKYELHHPSLGVFTVQVDGDVKSAMGFNAGTPRVATGISILNPFAGVSATPNMMSPAQMAFPRDSGSSRSSGSSNTSDGLRRPVLARLDFNEEVLHLDAGTIQSLGNLYLLDVCVSTLLVVALAEAHRKQDPGLIFAAPPLSLALAKSKSRGRLFGSSSNVATSNKAKASSSVSLVILPKRKDKKSGDRRIIDWSNANAVMGIEHLTNAEDLPRITRGVLGILGAGFKTAIWLLEFGVKISARMVIGLSRLATKE